MFYRRIIEIYLKQKVFTFFLSVLSLIGYTDISYQHQNYIAVKQIHLKKNEFYDVKGGTVIRKRNLKVLCNYRLFKIVSVLFFEYKYVLKRSNYEFLKMLSTFKNL